MPESGDFLVSVTTGSGSADEASAWIGTRGVARAAGGFRTRLRTRERRGDVQFQVISQLHATSCDTPAD